MYKIRLSILFRILMIRKLCDIDTQPEIIAGYGNLTIENCNYWGFK